MVYLVYHILQLHIFHDVNVIGLSMIWVSICYVMRERIVIYDTFQVLLELLPCKMKLTHKKRFFIFILSYIEMIEYCHHQI